MHIARRLLMFLAIVFLVLPGCQTTRKEPEPYPRAASKIPFTPRVIQAGIRAGEGAYPNLFTGASHAIWDPESGAAASKMAPAGGESAPMAAEMAKEGADLASLEESMEGDMEDVPRRRPERHGPLEIECLLESVFPDRSIAYDAVSLRGIEIYLQLPDGKEVLPVQKALDGALMESPAGALRRYTRKLTLYFPTRNFMVENPAANPGAKGIRLVMEGHGSIFYFEWEPLPDTLAKTEPRIDYQLRDTARKVYRSASDRAKDVSHTFD